RDGLTGLFNRRYTLEQLADGITRAISLGEHLAVALVDLDFFKRINDDHGHLVGDAVLRDFGKQVTHHVRATDLAGRYGGEEFVVVLRGATAITAKLVLEKLRAFFHARDFGQLPRYAFSAGIAELGVDGGEVVDLLGAADKRLYEAKRLGRDRTV
ncbi:MAG: GGDEF domain-containing protein, partial [Proteobacteria bacterium]|nr:GGDEF domain-containing protein [Pseudomonadota bacterium]